MFLPFLGQKHSPITRCPGPGGPERLGWAKGAMVNPAAWGYSTVTDLARLRGWSTSWPLAVASSQAKTCNGTVATSGWNSVGTAGDPERGVANSVFSLVAPSP